jgi:hypothetical protein
MNNPLELSIIALTKLPVDPTGAKKIEISTQLGVN